MSYMKHHTIVIHGHDLEEIREDIKTILINSFENSRAAELVSEIVPVYINSGESLFVAPDGSQEGWEESAQGDEARELILDLVRSRNLDFIEVCFGGSDYTAEILN